MVCEGKDPCFSEEEEAYIKGEIVQLEYMLSNDDLATASNLRRTFAHKVHVVDRAELYDVYYKRFLTSILLNRERQVEFVAKADVRPTTYRFATLEDPSYLFYSFGIGAVLMYIT